MMPIPVLLMTRYLDLGGSERQLTQIARALDRSAFEVHVGSLLPAGVREAELKTAGVPVHCFQIGSLRRAQTLAGAWQLGRYIRRHNIRLVHTFDVPATIVAAPAVRALSRAALLTSQRAHRHLARPAERRLLRITDRLAQGVVVNCEYLKRHLVEDEHVRPEKIHLCYNGIDVDGFLPGVSGKPPELAGAPAVIGVVCALRPEKDLGTLVKAFASLRDAHPGIRLLFVGDGACLPELRKQAADLGLGGDCVFRPATGDVSGWMRMIDIFVLPSRTEALSNALMEAMACGCCPVASRVGGNPELIAEGQTGRLFETGDSRGLAQILDGLLRQDGQRQRMASAASRWVRERFRLDAAARRMEQIYAGILGAAWKPRVLSTAAGHLR